MNLIDLFENSTIESLPEPYISPEDDQSVLKLSDLRKTRFTLKHFNKLRRLNDARAREFKEKVGKIANQYAPPQEAGMGMGF